jgi:hypothetical protein
MLGNDAWLHIPRHIGLKAKGSYPAPLGLCFSAGFGQPISWLSSILRRDLGVGEVWLPTFLNEPILFFKFDYSSTS